MSRIEFVDTNEDDEDELDETGGSMGSLSEPDVVGMFEEADEVEVDVGFVENETL